MLEAYVIGGISKNVIFYMCVSKIALLSKYPMWLNHVHEGKKRHDPETTPQPRPEQLTLSSCTDRLTRLFL